MYMIINISEVVMESILITENLSRTFLQGEREIHAVHNVSLEFESEKFYAITGPSGCGKTTLLHLLGALDQPTHGDVKYNGNYMYKSMSENMRADLRLNNIGFIFQNYNLISVMTAYENIITPCLASGKAVDQKYLSELCKKLGINDRLNHIPSELSGGEQQRVATARALIMHPSIILADEPTGNLDKDSAVNLLDLIFTLQLQYKKTIIMVTHDMNIASRADIHIKMDAGQIVSVDGR